MEAIRRLPQPVIAQVQGIATAAGCQLVATCDLVVAADDATFATPGVRIGLFCSTPAVALPRAVTTKKALEMLLTGEPISAAEAERIGLVNRVVPRDRLADETLALAQKSPRPAAKPWPSGSERSTSNCRSIARRPTKSPSGPWSKTPALPDAREGIAAFLEKSPAAVAKLSQV